MFAEGLMSVGNQLVKYCKENNTAACLNELYSPDAVSVEAAAMPGADSAESVGVDAIRQKHDWWYTLMDVHSGNVDGPYFHGADRFSVIFEIDATNRETGERNQMKEVAIYTVAGGKIVREEFYYGLCPDQPGST